MALKKFTFLIAYFCLLGCREILALESPIPHPECPQVDDVNYPKLLAYPGDCAKYYSCVMGLAYPQKCPDNLHFSRLASRCEYPEKAMCPWQPLINVSPPIPTPPPAAVATNITLPPPIYQIMPEIVYQLYPNDCNRYYKCEAMACPYNYDWNSQQQRCDFPHLAKCPFRPSTMPQPTIIPTAPTAPPTAAPTAAPIVIPTAATPLEPCNECQHFCMGQGHIYLPYPGDCRKFIQCNGLAFVHNCPNDLLWNDVLKTCDRFCITKDI